MDFDIPADYRVKSKDTEKINKYLDLAREQIKLKHEGIGDINCRYSQNVWEKLKGLEIRERFDYIQTTD